MAHRIDKEKFKDSYKSSLGLIWILGAYSLEYSSKYSKEYANKMADDLKKLAKTDNQAIKDAFESKEVRDEVRKYLVPYPACLEKLNAFEELYYKSNENIKQKEKQQNEQFVA